ncbi:MAG TPA: PHB depolymerase family esterase [Gemmatimonadales bacterium]|jgi:polyhydroxybutyrate depolymerase|nr:PHB depolymerase family esterase [Gemmatimonadales bacterium]
MPRHVPLLGELTAALLLLGGVAPILPAQVPRVEERRTLRVNGQERSYLLYVPSGHRSDQPAPLVLVFHGGGGRGRGMATHTGFSRLAEREGFVAVYPDGLGRRWNDGRGFAASHDDVGFVRALLDTLQRGLSLDPRRIYATGISNGAMFSYRLACDLPGVLAAVAPVAGALPAQLEAGCAHTSPVSVLAFQGTADPLVPYAGAGVAGTRGSVLAAERSIAFWAEVDGCTGPPGTTLEPDRVHDGTRVRRREFTGCREGRSVVLYAIEGGGHTWPGGPAAGRIVGRVTRELDATEVIWAFFATQTRAR